MQIYPPIVHEIQDTKSIFRRRRGINVNAFWIFSIVNGTFCFRENGLNSSPHLDGILVKEGTSSKHRRQLGDNTAFPRDDPSR
jgi:hypothetical protein